MDNANPILQYNRRSRRGRDRMVVGLVPMESVPITTNVVSSNPTQAMQFFVNKSLSVTCDRSVVFSGYCGFLHQ
jgi:hypothetical protein